MRLSDIARQVGGELIGLDADAGSFSTDTRSLHAGDVFIALSGPNFDANTLIAQAAGKGALAAIVTRMDPQAGIPQIIVADAHRALGQIAAAWRARFPDVIRVAMTGSAGKTSTKELAARIFEEQGETLATIGNLNNDIGVPLTLLRLRDQHQYGVFELGANHAGEIAYTAGLVQPHAAVITNVGVAHLEGFGSREGIARAKGEIYDALPDNGIAVVNRDDDFANFWLQKLDPKRVITFSQQAPATLRATDIASNGMAQYRFMLQVGERSAPVQLQLLGRHQVANALAAAALAHAVGIRIETIVSGLQKARPYAGRAVLHRLGKDICVIDDSYNANPVAMKAAIDLLAELPGRRLVVVGDMGELGESAAAGHEEVGEYARMKAMDAMYVVGRHRGDYARGFGEGTRQFSEQADLIRALEAELSGVVSILVKGSRSAHMDRVVSALTGQTGDH